MALLDSISFFISDWDETITTADSMHLIGEAAYTHKPGFEPEWGFFATSYMEDYRAHQKEFEDECGHLEGLEREIAFQERMERIEQQSVDRVEGSALFEGVPVESIRRKSSQVTVRDGWWELLAELKRRGIHVAIVSVNWSGELIRQVFRAHGYTTEGATSDVTVYANEIIEEDGIATGKLSRCKQQDHTQNDLRTGVDKKKLVQHLKGEANGPVCYCGDSGTDLLGLLEADIGIVVAKHKLVDKITAVGLRVLNVDDDQNSQHFKTLSDQKHHLYYINDWNSLLREPGTNK